VGAFRSAEAAHAQLRHAETLVPELVSLSEAMPLEGGLTRARFGGIAHEAAARRLCARVVDAGARCFVAPPGS
jgi:hypothetical protein